MQFTVNGKFAGGSHISYSFVTGQADLCNSPVTKDIVRMDNSHSSLIWDDHIQMILQIIYSPEFLAEVLLMLYCHCLRKEVLMNGSMRPCKLLNHFVTKQPSLEGKLVVLVALFNRSVHLAVNQKAGDLGPPRNVHLLVHNQVQINIKDMILRFFFSHDLSFVCIKACVKQMYWALCLLNRKNTFSLFTSWISRIYAAYQIVHLIAVSCFCIHFQHVWKAGANRYSIRHNWPWPLWREGGGDTMTDDGGSSMRVST